MADKLTARGVESRAKRKGRYLDGGGLFLRVLDPGKRVYWVYRYRVGRKDRETSVGAYPAMTLAEARIKHADLRAMVLKGIDPVGDRRRVAKAALSSPSGKPTFGRMADQYVETHETDWRNAKHRRQWAMTLTVHARAIRDTPVDQVDTQAVLDVLKPLWANTPETASRLRGRIEVVIDAARALNHISADRANPARWRGHLDKLLPKPKKLSRGHHKALPYADLPVFVARLDASDNAAARALALTILTACRTSEVLGATWPEINFDTATWTIPKERMKMSKAHAVPLSEQAVAILRVQEAGRGKNPHVFPGRPTKSAERDGDGDAAQAHGRRCYGPWLQKLVPRLGR